MGITADFSKLEALIARLDGLDQQITERLAERVVSQITASWSAVSPSAAGEPPAEVSGALGGSIRGKLRNLAVCELGLIWHTDALWSLARHGWQRGPGCVRRWRVCGQRWRDSSAK